VKTTELFVEQVLIGFMVLLVGALIFWGDVYAFVLKRSDKSDLIVIGGILIGIAYLIGMVYDRIADTLLQDIEAQGRLQFALRRFKLKSGKVRTTDTKPEEIRADEGDVEPFDPYLVTKKDPFSDGRYRIMVLGNTEATAQMEYLRSRIRLTRAMATIIPALTIALLLAVDNGESGSLSTLVALLVPIAYGGTLFLKTLKPENALIDRPPKTYKLKEVDNYIACVGMKPGDLKPWHISKLILWDEIWFGLSLLTLAGIALILKTGIYELLTVVVIGLVLSVVVGWTWWRISMTFYAFVRDYAKYGPRNLPG
jgi:hypothetical protein